MNERHRLEYSGNWLNFLLGNLMWFVLTLITCGILSPLWLRYVIKHFLDHTIVIKE